MRLALTAALAAVALAAGAGTGWGAPCVSYAPEIVTLEGTIHSALAYGPPNYGESPATDAKEHYQSLSLDKPLCVLQGDDELNQGEQGIRQVQLVTKGGKMVHDRGIHALVTGTLFHAFSGHHHTKVLIEVTKVQSTEE